MPKSWSSSKLTSELWSIIVNASSEPGMMPMEYPCFISNLMLAVERKSPMVVPTTLMSVPFGMNCLTLNSFAPMGKMSLNLPFLL